MRLANWHCASLIHDASLPAAAGATVVLVVVVELVVVVVLVSLIALFVLSVLSVLAGLAGSNAMVVSGITGAIVFEIPIFDKALTTVELSAWYSRVTITTSAITTTNTRIEIDTTLFLSTPNSIAQRRFNVTARRWC